MLTVAQTKPGAARSLDSKRNLRDVNGMVATIGVGESVGRGWSQWRVVAELRVGKEWLRREAAAVGITWSAPR